VLQCAIVCCSERDILMSICSPPPPFFSLHMIPGLPGAVVDFFRRSRSQGQGGGTGVGVRVEVISLRTISLKIHGTRVGGYGWGCGCHGLVC